MQKIKQAVNKTLNNFKRSRQRFKTFEIDLNEARKYFLDVEVLPEKKLRVYDSFGDSMIISYEQYREVILRRKKSEKKQKRKREEIQKNMRLNPPKRLIKILYNGYNQEFEKTAKNLERYIPQFGEIHVTKEVIDKANLIAKRTIDVKGNKEIYMHMLNYVDKAKQGDFTSRDVFIPYGQVVTSISCADRSRDGRQKTKQEIEKKRMIISGWAHSHANMNTFHSIHEDIPNLRRQVRVKGIPLEIEVAPFGIPKKYKFSFFPSLVFNARDSNPSCAISILYPQFTFDKTYVNGVRYETFINTSPRLKIINETNNIEMREEFIDREIRERVFYSQEEADSVVYPDLKPLENPKPNKKTFQIISQFTEQDSLKTFEMSSKRTFRRIYPVSPFSFAVLKRSWRRINDLFKKSIRNFRIYSSEIDSKLSLLEKGYAQLYNECEALRKKNYELSERVGRLEKKLGGINER